MRKPAFIIRMYSKSQAITTHKTNYTHNLRAEEFMIVNPYSIKCYSTSTARLPVNHTGLR